MRSRGSCSAATRAGASSAIRPRTCQLGDYQRPKYGIYAVRVTLEDGSEHPGVASFGVRPTFDPPEELLEAHLFGFDGDLYGQKIEVALHAYIREERKFESVEALIAEMRDDEAKARSCSHVRISREARSPKKYSRETRDAENERQGLNSFSCPLAPCVKSPFALRAPNEPCSQ